jgi:magnesium chelatase family protein
MLAARLPSILPPLAPAELLEVSIARANHCVTYPARFMLVAAMNPCRCGKANEPGFSRRRGPNARCAADYQARISVPLLDRIDLQIEVPAVTAADLILPPPTEGSREVAERVAQARERQAARYAAITVAGDRPRLGSAAMQLWREQSKMQEQSRIRVPGRAADQTPFRCASILSHIRAAISAPPKFFTARMPVGDVTLISVR